MESWDLNHTLYWTKELVILVSLGTECLRDTHRRSVKHLVHNSYGIRFWVLTGVFAGGLSRQRSSQLGQSENFRNLCSTLINSQNKSTLIVMG